LAPSLVRAQGYPRIFDFGAPASTADIAAVAIAIAPDGKGLPAGKGDYVAGKKVYESTCIACHGDKLQGVAGLKDMLAGAALRLIGSAPFNFAAVDDVPNTISVFCNGLDG